LRADLLSTLMKGNYTGLHFWSKIIQNYYFLFQVKKNSLLNPTVRIQSNQRSKIRLQSNKRPKIRLQSNKRPKVRIQKNKRPKVRIQSNQRLKIRLHSNKRSNPRPPEAKQNVDAALRNVEKLFFSWNSNFHLFFLEGSSNVICKLFVWKGL
jgi:hypothetical protein